MTEKGQPGGRSRARRLAVQALYQWQLAKHDPRDILAQFAAANEMSAVTDAHFRALVKGVTADTAALDALLEPHADRPVVQLDPVEHGILWVAVCELRDFMDIPSRAVINEAVECCKKFGATDGHKFVNALLDKAARELRAAEFA